MKELPEDFTANPEVVKAIEAHVKNGTLSCAWAFAIAETCAVPPLNVGQNADALKVHLSHCQLGLFGYPDHAKGWDITDLAARQIPDGLEHAIRAALNTEGQLTCPQAWAIAAQLAIPKMLVGYIADQMGVHIVECQLGAF